ncbi:EpsG family protein [Samsonia erythrinae]|uniref:EpsG-like putative glucosyltransferase n=1 Tax=Samsonia erythrinae TaxID=160434 RepID=A0A4R3VUF1_9GAMM|nr:EpsG family protein [Samsonia erythrinae]TCV08957.1 EpsG-like putative glucosyltransferase [Samsonia erythrinae]
MIYYFSFLFIVSFYLFLSYKFKSTTCFFIIPVIITAVFSAVRYDAGNDFFTYYAMLNDLYYYGNLEFLPRNIITYSKSISYPQFFFIITSFLYVFCIAFLCKKNTKYPELAFLIFILFPLSYLTSFGYVRQYCAIGFFSIAAIMFLEKRFFFFILFYAIAILFHSSAFLFSFVFLLYKFFSKRLYPWYIYLIFMVIAYLSSQIVLNFSYLLGSYSSYLDEDRMIEAGKKIGYVSIIFFWFFWLGRKNLITDKARFFFNLYYVFVLVYIMLMGFGEYVVRISYYLFPAAYVTAANVIFEDKKIKMLQVSFLLLSGLFLFYTTLYLAKNNPIRDFLTNYSIYLFN